MNYTLTVRDGKLSYTKTVLEEGNGAGTDDGSKILSTIFLRFADVTDGQEINPRTCVLFGVSNWGSQISATTVGELRNLKAGSEENSGILSI